MRTFVIIIIVFLLQCTNIEAVRTFNLTVGPKKNEKGRFVYQGTFGMEHCRICPLNALMDSTYSHMQQPLCINNYNNISAEVTKNEKDNDKYALCSIGDTPGCNSLPNISWTNSFYWYCDPGLSFQNYTVYFSCALICELTNKVEQSYYCNENLEWELEEVNSQQICQVPEEAPDSSQTGLFVALGFGIITVIACMVVFVVICHRRCKNKQKRKEPEDGVIEIPIDEGQPALGDNEERPNAVIPKECIPLISEPDNPSNDSGNSSASSGETSFSIEPEQDHRSCSVQTDHTSDEPSIKIMTCKNSSSQRSVPLQSSCYSIELGSNFYVMPDSPGGISVTDFIVKCKDEKKVFRGYKYNTFMYEVCKVCEEDADFYKWRMELENGRQYDGNFLIYVYPPEQLFSSANRREPEGEDDDLNDAIGVPSIANNQQVRAEVHEDQSYIPLSNAMFTHNNLGHRQDSGLSLGSLRSVAHSNDNRARGEDMAYSTSGYETQPSEERNRDHFEELLRSNQGLNPDSMENDDIVDSNSICGNNQELRSSPVGCVARYVHQEISHDLTDDDDDDDQTARKQYLRHGSVECSIPVNSLHGELHSTASERPLDISSQGRNVPNLVPAEEFHRRVDLALQNITVLPVNRLDLSDRNDLNHANISTSDTTEKSDSNPPEKSESNTSNNSHLGHVNNDESDLTNISDPGHVNDDYNHQ